MQEMQNLKPTALDNGMGSGSVQKEGIKTVKVTAGKVPIGVVPMDLPVGMSKREALEAAAKKMGQMRGMEGPAFSFDVTKDLPEINNKTGKLEDWEAQIQDGEIIMVGTRIAGNIM